MKKYVRKFLATMLAIAVILMMTPAISASTTATPVYPASIALDVDPITGQYTTTVGQTLKVKATITYTDGATGSSNPDQYDNRVTVSIGNNNPPSVKVLNDTGLCSYTFNTATVSLYAQQAGNCTVWITSLIQIGVYASANVTVKPGSSAYVVFDPNGGTGTPMPNQTFKAGIAQALSANTYTRDGYIFTGWATASNGNPVYSNQQSITLGMNTVSTTLYARWSPIGVTGISLNASSVALRTGNTYQLSAALSPSNALDKAVTWSSGAAAVGVDANGKVTALSRSDAPVTVTATSHDGGFTASCQFTVTQPVTGVTLNKSTAALPYGQTDTSLVAAISPANASNTLIHWSSTNPSVASVDPSTGKVTALSGGTANISVRTDDGNYTATCTYTITGGPIVLATGVGIGAPGSITVGSTAKLTAIISPPNATYQTVQWCSDGNIVTVAADGTLTGLQVGKTSIGILLMDPNNPNHQVFSASASITVLPVSGPATLVSGISLNTASLTMAAGSYYQLTAIITPSDAINKNVIWGCAGGSGVTVDPNGWVHAISATGPSVMVTATTMDGGYVASCYVTVK